ncbi:MAG TPA: hypothetical protein VGM88_07425 [Kofleriaceae bacterium]
MKVIALVVVVAACGKPRSVVTMTAPAPAPAPVAVTAPVDDSTVSAPACSAVPFLYCSNETPVDTPLTLPGARVRALFDDQDDGFHVVDYAPSGAMPVAKGRCTVGAPVAAAVDEHDRYYVLCAERKGALTVKRLEADGTFVPAGVPVQEPVTIADEPTGDETFTTKHVLAVDNGAMWIVYARETPDFKDYYTSVSAQAVRLGSKPFLVAPGEHDYAGAYADGTQVVVMTTTTSAEGHRQELWALGADRAKQVRMPRTTPSDDCVDRWHGSRAFDNGSLELHLEIDATTEDTTNVGPVRATLPHARAIPAARARGPGAALCNSDESDESDVETPDKTIKRGAETLATNARSDAALSCSATDCVFAYTANVGISEHEFRVRRLPPR